ncbi:PAS domain S-box protein [Methanobacterium petrolearium]|uniref:PAS domain S-box protein n=1 Tax=Methanobacterium petrolearium TaxID=710190 RepID=UPI001AE0F33F|nr:PAS domain S-box protein [Methanobacterium petrolearium]MBP1946293.1 PAS domain S-box-containing protein [Methanobacterium petrolearium]BDZ71389.1 hypothetical protein GCM10025861_19060 [Methanobacterium petrolearium]
MNNIKILVVEDETITAMDVKGILESFGYQVPYIASSGEEAVTKALEIKPDLILMDIILRGEIDGIDAVNEINQLKIPVVYLTAHSNEVTLEKAKKTEPYGYILKPFQPAELYYVIELALYKSKMENKLKEKEANYRLIVQSQRDLVIKLDLEGRFLFVSPSYCETFGLIKEKILGQHYKDFLNGGNIESVEKAFRKVLKSGKDGYFVNSLTTKQGLRWFSWAGEPVLDENKNIVAIVAVARDITEHKIYEEKLKIANHVLKKRDEGFEQFINHAPISIAMFDTQMRFLAVSKLWIEDHGLKNGKIRGKSLYELLPNFPDEWKEVHKKALNGSTVCLDEVEFVDPDGNVKYLNCEIKPWNLSSGDIGGVFVFCEDVTEYLNVKNELETLKNLN